MITVKVTCDTGYMWVTDINATLDQAKAYYIGKVFMIQNPDDTESPHVPITVEQIV